MQASQDVIQTHVERLLKQVDGEFRKFGVAGGLPRRLADALRQTPRHCFMSRFQTFDDRSMTMDGLLPEALEIAYNDAPVFHVDEHGAQLASTNSVPSYVLWLLHLLDVEEGDQLLEVGSGSGWLTAIAGRLVGRRGHATGVEIIESLGEKSKQYLGQMQIENVTICSGDAAKPGWSSGKFNKVIFTAGVYDFPIAVLDRLETGAKVLVPLVMRDGSGCHVSVCTYDQGSLSSDRGFIGNFVPFVGEARGNEDERLGSESGNAGFGSAPIIGKMRLWLGSRGPFDSKAGEAFRAFLARTESGFRVFLGESLPDIMRGENAFGIVDDQTASAAVWAGEFIYSLTANKALEAMLKAYIHWIFLGMPNHTAFSLKITSIRNDQVGSQVSYRDVRGRTEVVWAPSRGAAEIPQMLQSLGLILLADDTEQARS